MGPNWKQRDMAILPNKFNPKWKEKKTDMTGASTNPKKLTLKTTWIKWCIVWKYIPHLFVLIWPSELFLELRPCSKAFLGPNYVDNQLWFLKYNLIFLFVIWPHLYFFGYFWAIFVTLPGYFWGQEQVQKHFDIVIFIENKVVSFWLWLQLTTLGLSIL